MNWSIKTFFQFEGMMGDFETWKDTFEVIFFYFILPLIVLICIPGINFSETIEEFNGLTLWNFLLSHLPNAIS